MRAMMSDVDGGPVYLNADSLDGVECFGRPAADFAAEWALNEARAILAVSETGISYSCIGGSSHLTGSAQNLAANTPWTALATSLAAFLES